MWTSLEIAKLLAALAGPFAIAGSAILINRRLKRVEHSQWKNRRVIDKRIEHYERVAPELNDIYCYLVWVGNWQQRTPAEIIASKRDLDRTFHINRYILNDAVFDAYQAFMAVAFQTFNEPGSDAKIKTTLSSPLGNRQSGRFFPWDASWDPLFDPRAPASREQVKAAYDEVLVQFKKSIGLEET